MSQRRAFTIAVFVAVTALALGKTPAAWALPPFWKEFEAKYVKPDSADEKEKAFVVVATNAKTGKCFVCHAVGQEKKVRNAYGQKLSELLKKDNFKAERLKDEADKVKAEIVAALDAVAAMKSGDDKSPTFGELIVQGKLPGGDAPVATAADPGKPAEPAPAPAPVAATPLTPEAQDAVAKIQKIGGTVQALAMNDASLVVDFHLGGTALTDEGLALVKLLPNVVQLDLKDTQITDAGLANLAAIATLSRLHLEKTKVTDAGLMHLKDLGKLEYLNLYGTPVTDAGLEHLKGLTNLKKLYLWQSQVTDAGAAKLKEALPGVAIVK